MEKSYNPQEIENDCLTLWDKLKYDQPSNKGQPYCIMLPPPNVTGTLHMGHGFQQTLMDALVRYHRMQGHNTLWQGGTDHAGIATQMVVERRLIAQGKSRHDLGRKEFIKEVWSWRHHSGDQITKQMRRLGLSLDWTNPRFTMDETISRATTHTFIQLYNEGLIYQGKRLVNWDPVLLTAISDLEVETEEHKGHLWHIRYPLAGSDDYLTVATTRPETMLGDTAVAVHPEDERYKHLVGKKIKLPLTDREIPIIADDYVDKDFGSGCVKITPAHDFNDYDIGTRHQLEMINVLTPDAKINENAPAEYQGLDRFKARKKIVDDLKQADLLEKIEDHTLSIPKGDRSGAVIEPYLTDQWFIKMKSLAEPAIQAVKAGKLAFIPENWTKIYLQWLENIEDWCISRQLWWGHQIPVWYDEEGNAYVGTNEMDVRERNKLGPNLKLKQDHDVLDTWFSSSLWPFATLGWPQKTERFKTFYPTNVLVTGFDIIFFWVARMVMMGIKLTGEAPFEHVYITGLIRDAHGKKMSKSKGNVLDPIDIIDGISLEDLIEKRTQGLMQPHMIKQIEKLTKEEFPDGINEHGTDAVRFTFCALASTGRDINFDLGRTEGYRNFCNKLWNAARFVFMNTETYDIDVDKAIEYSIADLWIRAELQKTVELAHQYFSQYRFDLLAQTLYEFIWNEYCDWYLELAKSDLNNPDTKPALARGTRITLLEVLETILRLLHPITPFITEEIWQKVAPMLGKTGKSIMVAAYPEFDEDEAKTPAKKQIKWLKEVVVAIRTIRSEMNINPGKRIPIIFNKGDGNDHKRALKVENYLKALAKVNEISWHKDSAPLAATATAIKDKLEIHIPLADLIDTGEELKRLAREIEKLEKEQKKASTKLNNPGFLNKAPEAVVAKERDLLAKIEGALSKLKEQKVSIEKLN